MITSEGSEHSINSCKVEMTLTMTKATEDLNISQCGQTLSRTSKCVEHSMDPPKQMNSLRKKEQVPQTMRGEEHGEEYIMDLRMQ